MNIHDAARRCAALLVVLVSGCAMGPEHGTDRLTAATLDGQAVSLPHVWPRDALLNGQRIDVPFDVQRIDGALAVALSQTTLTFRASVNGQFVHETGNADSPSIGGSSYRARPHFRIPESALRVGRNVLSLELYRPQNTLYPLLGWVVLGDDQTIERMALRRLIAFQVGPLAIGVMLLAVGLVALGLWRGRRDADLFLLLAAGSLLWASQILLYQWPTRALPAHHWAVFLTSIYAWFPALIGVFFLRFAYRRSLLLERFAIALALLAAPLLYAGHALGLAEAASIALRGAVLLFVSVALMALLRYALQLRTVTGYLLFAMGAVCVGVALRDYVVSLQPDAHDVLILNPYSGVALLLFAGWMLLERHHKAYADFEMMNRELERRVAEANVELHRRLEQVDAARATAEQASVAKSRFFAAASHDLRQPLHSLGLLAGALRDTVRDAEGRTLVRRIADAIGALNRLFDELLDISRLEAGTVEVRRRDIALQPLFDRLDDEFHADASARGLRLRFHPTALTVHTDPTLLERIVANLVSNAVRYTPSGGVLVGARRRGGAIVLQVWDSGIGIAPEQRELIFEEFYQAGNRGRDPKQGLGLGLAIVRRLTALLDVPLALDSVPGRGSCFALTLPPARAAIAMAATEEEGEDRPFLGRAVAVLDDDAAICEATTELLGRWGANARSGTSLESVRAVLGAGFVPDAILADLRLCGEFDGVAAVEQLRAQLGRAVPALLISGDIGARELARVKASGLTLLTKPVAPARLRAALHALLDPRR